MPLTEPAVRISRNGLFRKTHITTFYIIMMEGRIAWKLFHHCVWFPASPSFTSYGQPLRVGWTPSPGVIRLHLYYELIRLPCRLQCPLPFRLVAPYLYGATWLSQVPIQTVHPPATDLDPGMPVTHSPLRAYRFWLLGFRTLGPLRQK